MNDLTLIIPAKNESETLPLVLKSLKDFDFKIIVSLKKNDIKTINSIVENKNVKLYFQNGVGYGNSLREAINIGGTELFKASFATGKALPCAIIINNKIKRCLIGKILSHCKWICHRLIR